MLCAYSLSAETHGSPPSHLSPSPPFHKISTPAADLCYYFWKNRARVISSSFSSESRSKLEEVCFATKFVYLTSCASDMSDAYIAVLYNFAQSLPQRAAVMHYAWDDWKQFRACGQSHARNKRSLASYQKY